MPWEDRDVVNEDTHKQTTEILTGTAMAEAGGGHLTSSVICVNEAATLGNGNKLDAPAM